MIDKSRFFFLVTPKKRHDFDTIYVDCRCIEAENSIIFSESFENQKKNTTKFTFIFFQVNFYFCHWTKNGMDHLDIFFYHSCLDLDFIRFIFHMNFIYMEKKFSNMKHWPGNHQQRIGLEIYNVMMIYNMNTGVFFSSSDCYPINLS